MDNIKHVKDEDKEYGEFEMPDILQYQETMRNSVRINN
jgi:hypothetical protein